MQKDKPGNENPKKVTLNYSKKTLFLFGAILFFCIIVILLFVKLTIEGSSSPKPIKYEESRIEPFTNEGNETHSETAQVADYGFPGEFFGIPMFTWFLGITGFMIIRALFGRRGIFR